MKWLRTLILFDKGEVVESKDWASIHESYARSIASIDFPVGSGFLKIRRKYKVGKEWHRNGVKYLRTRFLEHMVKVEGWHPERVVDIAPDRRPSVIRQFPGTGSVEEPITSKFGGFDFATVAKDGTKIAIEWETGNISSSHRSMNKLAIALANGIIDAGVLIVPSRSLYDHLTDRVGNIGELSGYLSMWETQKASVVKGLLAITVVEHDELTDDAEFPFLPVGNDGRAAEGRAKIVTE
jgi:hypothetical protein